MNPAELLKKHKKELGLAGAVAVGGLALLQGSRSRAAGDDAAPAGYPVGRSELQTGGTASLGYPVGYAAPYDSSASDVYQAIQPQIEYLQRLTEQQQQDRSDDVPVTAPTSPAAAMKAGWYKMAGTPNLYRIENGRVDFVTRKQFTDMTKGQKKPAIGVLSPDNPVWQNGAHWLDKHKQAAPAPAPTPTPTQ